MLYIYRITEYISCRGRVGDGGFTFVLREVIRGTITDTMLAWKLKSLWVWSKSHMHFTAKNATLEKGFSVEDGFKIEIAKNRTELVIIE